MTRFLLNHRFSKSNRVLARVVAVIACMMLTTGCQPADDPMLSLLDVDVMKTRIDDLGRTVSLVSSERRYDQQEFEGKVSSGLNRWSGYSEDELAKLDWSLDAFAQPLVEPWKSLPVVKKLDQLSFSNTDAWYLQQSFWLNRVAKRAAEATDLAPFELSRLAAGGSPTEGADDPVLEVVRKLHPSLDGESAEQLTASLKVFDWIVRNVQLTEATKPSATDIDRQRLNDRTEGPAAAGVRGTGYRQFAWQTLMFGRGDYVDRAKLFVLLLEQLDLESVVLALPAEDGDSDKNAQRASPTPWAVGVKIAGQCYLFDTRLGMPIPGPKPGQIATLADVRADRKLLSSLDLTTKESLADETDYWLRPEQVNDLIGLVYVSPEAISRRMAALEARLIGDDRLLLVSHPTGVAAAFESLDVKCQPWNIALQTHQFRLALRDAIAKSSFDDTVEGRLEWYYLDEAYIDQFTRYRTSRSRFIQGRFEVSDEERGFNAIESFQHLMYRDEIIDELGSDRKLQRQLGILKAKDQSAAEFQTRLASVQSQMRLVRRDAGFFLAQSHFDNGSVSTAANWLERLRSRPDAERWSDGVEYLLGRALEGRKDYLSSIDVYRESESPQSHGNLIRARLLKQQIDRL